MPAPTRVSFVHNDLKLDNCQFDPADPDRVQSIFDWDMTTLGEPLIDLGTLLNYWPDPTDPPNAGRVSHQGLLEMGLPTRAEITARYAERTGIETSDAAWYEAFAQWKTGVVIQQLHRRWERGESTDPRMETSPTACRCWRRRRRGCSIRSDSAYDRTNDRWGEGVTADREQLERAIVAQESLRGVVPDDVLDVAVGVLRRQLADVDAAASRRRQVTVLFADVSGFTAMSERMDAELVAGMMNGIWARFDLVVTEHGGRVDKHIGDAVMAVWGTERTQEDDPERAVRAGLALQAELTAFNAQAGVALAIRVGISTGLAHLGTVGTTSESTVMGDTVNLASRLEHLAPINGVLISHDTYRSVRGVFDVQALGEVEVRGKQEPVRLYLVERAKQLAFRLSTRGVEGVETRMIGRDDELGVLRDSFGRVAAGAGATLVLVVADAGTGKSRLLYEFLSWLELTPSETWMFTGRAFASRRSTALGVVPRRHRDPLRHARQRWGADRGREAAARVRAVPVGRAGRDRRPLVGVRALVERGGAGPARSALRGDRAHPPPRVLLARSPRRTRWCSPSRTCTGPTTSPSTSSTT